jgi:phage repressor protein C with HTH and peptisase S24 domain
MKSKSDKKYDDMFAILMHGTHMEGRLRKGNLLWILPHVKPTPQSFGVLLHTGNAKDGHYVAGFVKETRTHWHVEHHNPPAVFRVRKKDRPFCETIGMIDYIPRRRRRDAPKADAAA